MVYLSVLKKYKKNMNEISIKLQGGMGNYMFQIAATYAYALKYNKNAFFTINDAVLVHKNIRYYKDNIFKNVNLVDSKRMNNKVTIYNEPHFHYSEIPKIDGDIFLNGYFQSEKYFNEFSNEIKNLFAPSNESLDTVCKIASNYNIDINSDNTCSIHVRRGDYLKFPDHHPTQNLNYYLKAIKLMPKDSVFLIFSDDINWCKETFPNIDEKFKFINGNTDYEDLTLMSLCKNNIICNSTFSWWAAWLNKNENKKIIIPTNWFGPAYNNSNTDDLYCENWIKLK